MTGCPTFDLKGLSLERARDLLECRDGGVFRTYDHARDGGSRQLRTVDKEGYLSGNADGALSIKVHRAVWFLHHGWIPAQLDHIDRDPTNNRIENLRAASKEVQARNRQRTPTAGVTGVRRRDGSYYQDRFMARTTINGAREYLGVFYSKEAAARAVQNRRKEARHV